EVDAAERMVRRVAEEPLDGGHDIGVGRLPQNVEHGLGIAHAQNHIKKSASENPRRRERRIARSGHDSCDAPSRATHGKTTLIFRPAFARLNSSGNPGPRAGSPQRGRAERVPKILPGETKARSCSPLKRAVFRDLNGCKERLKADDHIALPSAKVCDGQAPLTSEKRLG